MKRYTLDSSVSELPGVGATRQKQLEKLGVRNIKDLIYLFPRAYENRGNVKKLSQAENAVQNSFILTVATEPKNANIRRGFSISKFRAFDETGSCDIVFFNSPYIKDVFHVGSVFRFYGKVEFNRRSIQLSNPKFEPVIEGIPLPPLVPIYPLTEGISSKFIDKLTITAFNAVIDEIVDPIPDDIRIANSLPVISYALKNIHFPSDSEALEKSLKRLAFDEFFLFGIGISLSSKYKKEATAYAFKPCDLTPLTSLLPYELTLSQKNTVNDIYKDTVRKSENAKTVPMSRIVVGDVGSGKTVCALAAIYIALKSNFQCAMMVPTEILAHQHYKEASNLFDKLGLKTEILLGSTSQKEKKRIYSEIQSGIPMVVIGTHALISDKVEFSNLGLVITDEQHRFGIAQRATLKEKSEAAHLLVMSATPIPRTLALTMYGDLDVSRITEMPKGRMKVDTFAVNESYRERLNLFIKKQIENGGQCYIVCPAIEKEDDTELLKVNSIKDISFGNESRLNLKNAIEYAENLKQIFPDIAIECLHGRLKSSEKDEIMERFSTGESKILVSTTVIEVGVNVPNASLMIVENADRFGLAQLHQLRGRVGRGTRKSYCVLVSDLDTDKAKSRLEIMKTTYDGYEIAEKDLILRGPGDFFATAENMRQSGGFEFKLAKLCDDSDLYTNAFAAAKALINADPNLASLENAEIKKLIAKKFAPSASTIS